MKPMMMSATALLIAGFATIAVAQSDVIAERQKAMKAAGAQAKIGAQMAKGEVPFDAAKAVEIFKTYAEVGTKAASLFPENSKTGGDTAALPEIWVKKADFEGRLKKWADESKAAADKAKDEAGFKAAFGEVMKNCGGCHENYRAKKS